MDNIYHLWISENADGPYTRGQIALMHSSGKLSNETLISPDRGTTWFTVEKMLADTPIMVEKKENPPDPSIAAFERDQKFGCRCCLFVFISPFVIFIALLIISSFMPKSSYESQEDGLEKVKRQIRIMERTREKMRRDQQ